MRHALFIALCLGAVPGCGAFHDIELYALQGPSGDGGACPSTPDMTVVPPAKCAAAKGLAGDTLACADFTSPQTLTDLQGKGWDFTSLCPAGWTVIAGKLQVNSFSSFASSCIFTLPALNQNYKSFTLAVLHTVDLNSVKQKAQVMLGGDDEQLRLLDWMTGTQPRKHWVQTVAKGDLPAAAGGMYQPLFKLSSGQSFGMGYQGWQIESIAVMGNAQ